MPQSSNNTAADLMNHLFNEIETLKHASPSELSNAVKRAQAVVNVSHAITDLVKTGANIARATNCPLPETFFEVEEDTSSTIATQSKPARIGDGKLTNERMPWPKGHSDAGLIGLERKSG